MGQEQIDAAVRYYFSQTGNIIALWGIYIAATFTGAAFSVTDVDLSIAALMAVTAGFWAFALGHAAMLHLALKNLEAVDRYLAEPGSTVETLFPLAAKISSHRHRPWASFLCHFVIDICVTLLIWREVLL